jgi:hypothetical protein
LHLAAAARHEIILAGLKQALAVLPWGRQQRYAASERLEHPNRRHSEQLAEIGTSAPGATRDLRHDSTCTPDEDFIEAFQQMQAVDRRDQTGVAEVCEQPFIDAQLTVEIQAGGWLIQQ